MPESLLFSWSGALCACVYLWISIQLVRGGRHAREDATDGPGLRGMAWWIATLPVSLPAELVGLKLDHRSNFQMGLAITLCAALVYVTGAALGHGLHWWAFPTVGR